VICPQHSFFKLNDNISIFNIELSTSDEEELLKLLSPIQELLNSHKKNSIYLYMSGGLFHAEGIIQIGEKYANANSVGCNLSETIKKLTPKLIEATSASNLYPRNKQLCMGERYEVITK